MKNKKSNTLILGLGNDILCDDAIGVKILEELKNEIKSDNIDFKVMCSGGLDIVDIIIQYKLVIIIDSMTSTLGIPGKVYHLTPENFSETHHLSNLHDVSFISALKLADEVLDHLPEQIHILAVEIIEDKYFSEQFSPEIESKYEGIYEVVKSYVIALLDDKKKTNNNSKKKPSTNLHFS
jgi:hydrogenase maturation protease